MREPACATGVTEELAAARPSILRQSLELQGAR